MDIQVTTKTQPAKTSSITGSLFEVVFLIVVIVVGYFYLVAPKYTAYKDSRDALQAQKDKLTVLQDQKKSFAALAQQLESSSDAVVALDAILPLDSKPSRLYVLLENLIQSTGLTSGSVTVDSDPQMVVAGQMATDSTEEATERTTQSIGVSVSATGTIDQLTAFLRAIETSNRYLEVSNLDVSQGRGDLLVFKLGLKAYSYTPEVQAVSVIQ